MGKKTARAIAHPGWGSSAGPQGARTARLVEREHPPLPKARLIHFPGPTQTRRKSRLSVPGRSSLRGPVSLVGSAPFRCIALLRPPGGGETSERPLWPTTAARLLRGELPTCAAATASRQLPGNASWPFPRQRAAGRYSLRDGPAVGRLAPPASRPPWRAVLGGAGSSDALGALLGLAGVRVRGHLRPGAGTGAGGERGAEGAVVARPRALCAWGAVGQTPRRPVPLRNSVLSLPGRGAPQQGKERRLPPGMEETAALHCG